ncbi:MAG: LuxR C-terminal-related transcriptional regulator [Pseudoflavonifractor capillosus]|uniref:helix-turn-helix transcriptional regulator n=1 Tax=Pseudoflavonifractor capillosus TaxID=106588 RepID=UPI0023F75BE1|nr:LuxR C-terminal-related transcriptional regulator [Pseudoflavonifractor capillosus]MCI5928165.1 LuxR C-terminal-related transcriptional regulator [Pseudoflavonifractor capillosus]MDY4659846.1 LuxR C-terminal-related transcriptional regulator [Pseudoflavonifractor capillosus]
MKLPGARILSRARVNRQLEQILDYPLTVLRAPMGFGKTTAVREYFHTAQLEPLWLSLLGSGGSMAYCWERLTSRIAVRDPKMAERLLELGFPENPPQQAKIVALICEKKYSRPTVLVIDDYQLIDCPETAALLTLITGEQVENLHIVLLTRNTPCLPTADLEQRGLCWVGGQDLFRFRTTEIQACLELMEFPNDTTLAQQLGRWTGGWISGIYLILRGMSQGLSIGAGQDIDQLMDRNLYSIYDAETQTFLQKLSFLDAFTPEQVSYALQDPGAAGRLTALAQDNAFIAYNVSLGAYKMTDLFQKFLQERGRQAGLDPKPLWYRMGRWFLNHGKRILAYDYLYRSGEVEEILQDLNSMERRDIQFAHFPQVHKIFEGLAPSTAFRYPLATLRHIRIKALSEPPSARGELELHLEHLEEHFLNAKDISENYRTFLLGEIHNTWVFVAFNDVRQVIRHAELAVRYFNGRYSCVVNSYAEFTFGAPHLLYCYYKEPGKLRETAQLIAHNFHTLAQAVEGCGAGSEPLALAEYALETGNLDDVELHAQKAIYQSRFYRQTSIELCATFVLARLALYHGKFQEGERLLKDLAGRLSKENSSVLNTTLELCSAYTSSCFGRVAGIPAWLRENNMDTGHFMFQGMAFPYIVCMRAVLLTGAFVRLEVLCQEFRKKFDLYQNQLGYIHNDICAAIASEKLYGIEAGCEKLEQALVLAAQDNVVMPFAENALGIMDMLRKVRNSKKVPQAFLAQVIRHCEHYQRSVACLLPPTVTLSEREHDILQMLSSGMKHEEIASSLFISVPTVRYHVKNIYQKLEVNNKISAIQTAKAMGLLE